MNERKQLRKARAVEAQLKRALDDATTALLRSADGRKFLWWLLDITRYGQSTFTANALTTAFACGEQNVGLQLLAQLTEIDPEGFLDLLKERNDERHDESDRDDDDSN